MIGKKGLLYMASYLVAEQSQSDSNPTRNNLRNYHLNMAMARPSLKLIIGPCNMSVTYLLVPKLHKQRQFSATYRTHTREKA